MWHLSLSNPVGDRRLSDVEWAEIAGDVMDRMGFSGADGRAPCPWVAVGHGPSAAGNDHIHMAVSLVREDGTVASVFRDRVTLSRACSVYEERYGLTVVAGRHHGTVPAPSRAEMEAAARRGRPEPDRSLLARRVRAAATASRGEAEFVRRLRGEGIMVRPHYAKGGGRGLVDGYSVAVRPGPGRDRGPANKPIFYGGGTLARDLRLPALRAGWGPGRDDQAWATGTRSSTTSGRDAVQVPPAAWAEAADQTERVWRTLATVPVDDQAGWAAAAGDAAGVLGALSARLEPAGPGPLARAADAMARAAQRPRSARPAGPAGPGLDLRRVAAVAAQATLPGGPGGWILVVAQLVQLAKVLEQAQRAVDRAATAGARAAAARAALVDVHIRYAPVTGRDSGGIGPGPPGRGPQPAPSDPPQRGPGRGAGQPPPSRPPPSRRPPSRGPEWGR